MNFSRRAIIATGIFFWCTMTAACGMAHNYGQLFVARIGVGVGEAALSPSALSLISDYFPQETRGRAVSFYTMGISLGSGLAMLLGGTLAWYALTGLPVHYIPPGGPGLSQPGVIADAVATDYASRWLRSRSRAMGRCRSASRAPNRYRPSSLTAVT